LAALEVVAHQRGVDARAAGDGGNRGLVRRQLVQQLSRRSHDGLAAHGALLCAWAAGAALWPGCSGLAVFAHRAGLGVRGDLLRFHELLLSTTLLVIGMPERPERNTGSAGCFPLNSCGEELIRGSQ